MPFFKHLATHLFLEWTDCPLQERAEREVREKQEAAKRAEEEREECRRIIEQKRDELRVSGGGGGV